MNAKVTGIECNGSRDVALHLRLPAGAVIRKGDLLMAARGDNSKERRLLALLAKLIEEHAPHKFGPCICELCVEYGQLVGFTYSDPAPQLPETD